VGIAGSDRAHLLKSTNGGGTWQELASPGLRSILQVVVQSGSPATLVAVSFNEDGVRISRDGGASWLTALADWVIAGVAQDPGDLAHMVAWGAGVPAKVFETRDGGTTWEDVSAGLPEVVVIGGIALDPEHADRM